MTCENAGWVQAVGPAVEHLAVGDPVICHPNLTCGVCRACRAGDDMRCGQGPNLPGLMCAGGMAELFKTTNANEVIDDLRHGRIRGRAILIP